MYNERIQTIVRSRGESILLSQAIEISLEEESAVLLVKERSPSAANGPPLRCNKCKKLGHTASKSSSSDRFPVANVKAVLNCFNCSPEGHVANDCRRRPTYKDSVGRDTEYRGCVGRDTDKFNRARDKNWIRSGNDGRGVVEQPDYCPPERVNGCPQFTFDECERHSKSELDTVTIGVHLSKTEKMKFIIDTGAEISIVKGAGLRPGFD